MAGTASCNVFALKALPSPTAAPIRRHARPLPCSTTSASFRWPTGRRAPLLERPLAPRAAADDGEKWGKQARDELKAAAAADDDEEWGKQARDELRAAAEVVAVAEEATETRALKEKMFEAFRGTDRGLRASGETRAEVDELIAQLEAKNPTPAPTEAVALLDGKWILVYASFSQFFPLLGSGSLLMNADEILQSIDSETFTVQNSVKFVGPLATTAVSTNATYVVRSPKRVQIKFNEGVIGTPQLTDSIEFPDKVEILGQSIDLSPLKGVIASIQDSYSSVAKTISGQPPLKIPISAGKAESWLLTTYLDEELRISRGDGGSVFVLVKEGSSLLN
ncbi:putative plastid-lipid-associated protein 2, chloroplastic [Iris pallida]|uniref:Plastid-lipid-associated protein 2, chloroplastic n=1 Tax=Iris pallida TaxID=29817 RepID=A0AAX6FAP6_IRIPA|nr:putative plastid-lipid-associated protein 2, chloroplastic [Iris pallida]